MTVRTLISGLVVVFVGMLVPAGLAAERPDNQAGPIGVGGVTQTDTVQFKAYGTADTIVARLNAGLDAYGNEPVAATPTADTGITWSDPLVFGVLAALVAGLAAVAVFAVVHHHGGGPPGTRGTTGRPTVTH